MKKKSGWRGWSLFENNPFIEGFAEWMDSSDGELFDEVRELTWQSLKNVDVDASARKLIWEDGKRLSIDESVQRIHADYPEFPLDLIEYKVIAWLEMELPPEGYYKGQLEERARRTGMWIDEHNGGRKRW